VTKPPTAPPRFIRSSLLAALALLGAMTATSAVASPAATSFGKEIRHLLAEYCFDCHGPEKQKGDLRLDELDPDFVRGDAAETWHDVLDQLNLGEMPPEKAERRLASAERKSISTWINESLREAAAAHRFSRGRVVTRRLTRYEYANTMRDLLALEDLDLAIELPPEPISASGFLNDGAVLEMSPSQVETYLAAARRALAIAIVSGDKPEPITYTATETARGKLPNRKEGGQVPANPEFVLDVKKFPRAGRIRNQYTARAAIPGGDGFPRMHVSMGHVPGIIHIPRKTIGEVELTSNQPQTFTFHGRMEDFPQSGEVAFGTNVSFNGMIVMLDFLNADGKELRYPDREYVRFPPKPKKGEKAKPKPTPPPFGSRLEIQVDKVEFEAPFHTSWPPPSHRLALGEKSVPDDPDAQKSYARVHLARFMERAFRRPVASPEIVPYAKLYDRLRAESLDFESAISETFAAVLVSPQFLYIVEKRDPNISEPQPLTGFELASRLSYFLWSTRPDNRLLDLAKKDQLARPAILKREVQRLLADERSNEFVTRFAEQWFDLGALDRVAINPEFYPDFDNSLKGDMHRETIAFFDTVLRENRSCLELIDSDWTMANRALANHYGIDPAPRTSVFEKVSLDPAHRRGGILGHGSFLLSQSNGEASHPIKRAVWILDRLLGAPPLPPPPAVPELDSESPELAGLTLKQQLELHREEETCRNCHEDIDPWGIPLEHFDATGRWRETAPVRLEAKGGKKPALVLVDASALLPGGTELEGAAALKTWLLEHRREWFARSLVERLLAYSLGRSLDLGDRETVDLLTREFIASEYHLRDLILALAASTAFQTK
jgi:mono/diheme cytochrome c family protein